MSSQGVKAAIKGPNHNYICSSVLPKLLCAKCKKYLSHFPIYTNPVDGSICGRCTVDNKASFFRNELYETAVHMQRFPCIYENNGCLEKLLPSSVPGHELRCYYRKLACPTQVYNNCTWQGYFDDLLDHFEHKHPTFILQEGTFEIDFVNLHKEDYIFPYGEDLYVVRRQAIPASKKFICCVSEINLSEESKCLNYILTLESGNKKHKHSLSQGINKNLEIDGDSIKSVLNDPTSIIARLDIQKLPCGETAEGAEIDENKENETDTAIDYEQLEDLECPVCLEYFVPPIYQCDTGHSICLKCKDTEKQCPLCRVPFREKMTQNYNLEKVVQNLIYPCKHSKCRYSTKAKDIKQHEAACIFGPFKCPLADYENCKISMSIMDIYDHIVNNHYESLLELDVVSIPFEIKDTWTDEDSFEECYIIKHSLHLFKLCFMFKNENCFWSVQLVGPPEECFKFKFELEILDSSRNNGRIYFKKGCAPLADKAYSFTEDKVDNFIYLELKQIRKFVLGQLSYRVRVFLNQ